MLSLSAFSYCMFILFGYTHSQSPTTIHTKLGRIQGTTYGAFSTFMGIPYTEDPPTGDNRFRPSIKKTSSYSTTYLLPGIVTTAPAFNATSAGPQCLQPNDPTSSEDCLSLNVFTPDTKGSYPVMVWIHGGGFQSGSGYAHGLFNGVNFATKGIVFVSINYRLGLLGFLPSPEIAKETGNTNGGMNGVYDQIVALQWIHSYISDFGGDASDVTIFGESAGGLSVCALLFSPIATGLFKKAIIQSGACNGGWGAGPMDTYGIMFPLLMRSFGWEHENLTTLRLRPSSDFRDKGYIPSTDGYIVPNDNILDLTDSISTLNAEKIMIGTNSMDTLFAWTYYTPADPMGRKIPIQDASPKTSVEMKQYLTAYFDQQNDRLATRILSDHYDVQQYEALDVFNEHQIMWLSMSGEACLVCPSFELLEWIVQNPEHFSGSVSTDLYLYHFVGPTAPYYAHHFGEVPFVFGLNVVTEKVDTWHMDWDQTLSDHMNTAWANFVKDVTDVHLVSYGTTQNSVVFGGENGIQHVNNYYDDYKDGWCPFLSTQVSAQKKLCQLNTVVDVATTSSTTVSSTDHGSDDSAVANSKSIDDFVAMTVLIYVVVVMGLVITGCGLYWMKRKCDQSENENTNSRSVDVYHTL